jgi:prepilin-type processing-associated H-X9-DG protein
MNKTSGPYYSRSVTDSAALRDIAFNSPLFSFRSSHSGGCNFLMGDGGVKFLRDSLDMTVYRALGSRNGGEVLGDF